jgi:hypothetical protein
MRHKKFDPSSQGNGSHTKWHSSHLVKVKQVTRGKGWDDPSLITVVQYWQSLSQGVTEHWKCDKCN